MKKIYAIVILLSIGITQTQIYAQCFNCDNNTKAFSIGTGIASGTNSFAGGNLSTALGNNSFVFGENSIVFQPGSIALGNYSTINSANSYVFGQYLNSSVNNSITIGLGTSSSSLLSNSKPGSIMFGVTHKPSLTILKPSNADVGYLGIGTEDPKQMVHIDEGNLLITSLNSGTTNAPNGALLFSNVIDEFITAQWGIEYLNSTHPVYGGTGLNFRKYLGKFAQGVSPSILFLADNGRIGIGNKEPMAKLDVAGSFIAQSANISGNIVMPNIANPTSEFEKNAIVFDYLKGEFQNFPPPGKWGIERVGSGVECGLNIWKYGYYASRDGEESRGLEHRSVMFFDKNDNVGIGTENPQAKLDISGALKAASATLSGSLNAQNAILSGALNAASATLTGDLSVANATLTGALNAQTATVNGISNLNGNVTVGITSQSTKLDVNGALSARSATINGGAYISGNVGIGINPTTNKLEVKGTIRAEEVRVCVNQGCDFVFEEDYELMSLNDLNHFIKTNKHLPNVAPAAKMEAEGINLSEMNATLLQKVEELTLYVLDLQKQIDELKNR